MFLLLRLPLLCIQEVTDQWEIIELINFSLLSKRARRISKRKKGNGLKVELKLNTFSPSLHCDYICRLTMEQETRGAARVENISSFLQAAQHLMDVLNCPFERIFIEFIHLLTNGQLIMLIDWLNGVKNEINEVWIQRATPSLLELFIERFRKRIRRLEVISTQFKWGDIVQKRSNFKISHTFYSCDSEWVHLDFLLSIDCEKIFAYETELTAEDLNVFLRNWQEGKTNQRLKEMLGVNVADDLNETLNAGTTAQNAAKAFGDDYKTNLENLWAMVNLTDALNYLDALSQASIQLKTNYTSLSSITNDLEGLKDEFAAVDKGLTEVNGMKHVARMLSSAQEFFESMKSNPLQSRYLTPGFPNGTSDMKLLFKEVKEDWLKSILAKDNEEGWSTLVKELDGFKALSEKSEAVSASWKSLEAIANLKELSATTNLWSEISATSLNSAEVRSVQESAPEIGKCLNGLQQFPDNFEIDSFKTVSDKVKGLARLATNSYRLFGQLTSIHSLQNDTLVDSLITKINQTDTSDDIKVGAVVQSIRDDKDFRELIGGIYNASLIMKKIEGEGHSKVLNFKGINLSLMINMQEEFEKTQLISSLDCLKNENFDDSKISETLKFGSDLRALGLHSKQDKTTVQFLKQMVQFKKSYVDLIGTSNNRTAVSYFSSLDKPLSISKDLAKGVELVKNLAGLQANEQLINKVAGSKKEILDEMNRVLPSIDISSFTNGLLKMVQDLKSLVSRIPSEMTLEKYEKLFGAASGISGVPINSTLLIDPVSTALLASKRKTESNLFRELGGFELDYSSHQKELNTASLTVIKLKQYFERLFSDSKGDNDKEESQNSWIAAPFVVAVLAGIGGHFGYWRMQKDPNSFLYLIQALPTEKNRFGRAYWDSPDNRLLPIHDAIRSSKFEKFKKEVDNGANVNAFCSCSNDPRTTFYAAPIHLAYLEEDPKFVEYLIKNGAQLDLLDSAYQTANDYYLSGSFQKLSISPKLEGKQFSRRVPPQLKPEEFQINGSGISFESSYPKFHKKFGGQTGQIKDATHIVFPVTKEGNQINLETYEDDLPFLFCGKMIMSESWIKKNDEKPGRKLKIDYTKDRVTSVFYNGRGYDTVCQIYTHIQERRIPYLAKIKAYFYGQTAQYWYPMAATVNLLGGVSMSHELLPKHNDPIMMNEPNKYSFYYFKNRGPIFIFTDNPEEVMKKRSYLRNNNWITWTETRSFIDFVLKFEFPEFPPKKGEKVERTRLPETFDYNKDDEMANVIETEWDIKHLFFE
uniref:ANK_REP_REGION domain-containing protein n=1 Tax=Caenorhabditis tropicalis TaxID=1561998 RepID=A0A1I7V1B9_9PELO